MARIYFTSSLLLFVITAGFAPARTASVPYTPGQYQSANPTIPANPFYFEGKVDWDKLKIDQPANTWDYLQRGITSRTIWRTSLERFKTTRRRFR